MAQSPETLDAERAELVHFGVSVYKSWFQIYAAEMNYEDGYQTE